MIIDVAAVEALFSLNEVTVNIIEQSLITASPALRLHRVLAQAANFP